MEEEKKLSKGGRNLAIMGLVAIMLALLTTSISLIIYHNSGDIYLDRSRPGFLPDEEELELDEIETEDEGFNKSGKMSDEVVDEYIEKLKKNLKVVDSYEEPFGADALSDERLGI